MIFKDDVAQTVTAGEYNYIADAGTGAVTLTMSLSGGDFIAVPGGAFTAYDAGLIVFATCRVKAGIPGDAKFIMNSMGYTESDYCYDNIFGDVPSDIWYKKYACAAFKAGIMQGYGNAGTVFGGAAQVNKAQFPKMLVKAHKLPEHLA